ncbi:MFS transporter [Anaerosinus massiliensis]|uniref:MFS transporter n=1 Tax=Massilibacillus massiliensis TaxID=1806837 RepID=UPI0018FEA02E|nr:MFS transporter [Massilibacillus massiliensis]
MSEAKTTFLSIVCLIITTSLYAAQPILPELAADFHSSISQMGIFMTLIFFGNGIAQVMVIPLADKYERRSLAQIFLLIGILANIMMAFSPSIQIALFAGLLIGFYSCANMLILSFASSITENGRKGKVTASIMGGVLSGILLSRMISGSITELYSWRAVYLVITLCLIISSISLFLFPKSKNESNGGIAYSKLLLSITRLIRNERGLRKRMISGMSSFLVFNFLWTGLTFLLSSTPFHFDSFTIGLFGLAGISGILASKKAGSLFDRGLGEKVILYAWILLGISWFVLMSVPIFSPYSIVGAIILLVIGIIILDTAMQAQHITNQTFILSSYGKEESRALTAYMSCNLLMASVSNLITSLSYSYIQWIGICIISIGVCIVNVFIQRKYINIVKKPNF